MWKKQYEQAVAEAERATILDPNEAEGYVWLGEILAMAGRPEEGSNPTIAPSRANYTKSLVDS